MGKQWKQCQILFWGGSKITADGDCSHEIKRRLLLGKKAIINLHSVLKSRDITLLKKDSYNQSYDFSSSHVEMWESDHKVGWAPKKLTVSNLWCWRRLSRVPCIVRKSNQSILKEISPEYSLECWSWSSNTLVTWWEKPTHWKRPWHWERLRTGGEGGNRG